MNHISLSDDSWSLTKMDTTIVTISGTINERIQELTQQLQASPVGGVVDKTFVFTNEEGTFSVDQWLTEKLNKPYVQGTSEEFQKKAKEIPWRLEYYGYTPGKDEYSVESLLTVGNGFMGLRGATPEMEIAEENYPALYLASLYNTAESIVSDRTIANEDFVNAPNLQKMYLIIDGERLDIANNHILSMKRTLDLRQGLFESDTLLETKTGKQIILKTQKAASMENVHQYSLRYQFLPVNFSGEVTFVSEADGAVYNFNVARYRSLTHHHLAVEATEADGTKALLAARTLQSQITIRQQSELTSSDVDLSELNSVVSDDTVKQILIMNAVEGQTYTIEKTVEVHQYRKEDTIPEFRIEEQELPRFDALIKASQPEWAKLWQKAKIELSGDLMSQKMLNLHTYHILVSASPQANQELDASVTARGLHGEAYRGHIFWDELFILPFYIVHFPETARALLMYRYRRLEAAKKDAVKAGYEGAMFPWQSGLEGTEQSQELHLNPISGEWKEDHSRLQRHVSLAIAYNVWQYWHNTKDRQFMQDYGLELMLEIAHFWQSAAKWDEATQRYNIERVMGPDEFHEAYPNAEHGGLKNNAYTNMMVVWLFEEVAKLKEQLGADTFDVTMAKVAVNSEIFASMQDIRKKLALEISPDGIIAQFEGYFDLADLDWDYYREKYGNIYRMDRILNAEGKSADAYKVAKQADSLMIFYNFSTEQVNNILADMHYQLPKDYIKKNLEYYLERTSHGSTLSRVVHAQLAAMVDQKDLAWKLYQEALYSDYRDIQGGTTAEGIHAGVMAATLFIPLMTFAGVDTREDQLKIQPNLPENWTSLKFNLEIRGITYQLNVTHETLSITADQPTTINVLGNLVQLKADQEKIITI